jgi:glycosyltransferase involved in cell wall biosynthesis
MTNCKRYDIIIPVFNQGDLTLRCLQTIKAHSKDFRAIVVDNGSDREERNKWLPFLQEEIGDKNHLFMYSKENMGFVEATNAGLQVSTAPYVVLLNNDAEAVEGWLEALEEPFHKDEEIGITGPLSDCFIGWQAYPKATKGYCVLGKGRMLAFFCAMIKREVIKQVGLLSTEYGIGLGDDDDYCYRTERAGFRLALVTSIVVPHKGRTTFEAIYTPEQIKQMSGENYLRFMGSRKADPDTSPKYHTAIQAVESRRDHAKALQLITGGSIYWQNPQEDVDTTYLRVLESGLGYDYLVRLEDDAILAPDYQKTLEWCFERMAKNGYWAVMLFSNFKELPTPKRGHKIINIGSTHVCSGVGLIYDCALLRDFIDFYKEAPMPVQSHRLGPPDISLGLYLQSRGLKLGCLSPSIIQHLDDGSELGHGKEGYKRRSHSFTERYGEV